MKGGTDKLVVVVVAVMVAVVVVGRQSMVCGDHVIANCLDGGNGGGRGGNGDICITPHKCKIFNIIATFECM